MKSGIVGDYMSRTLGQQFIIENVPGAGGTTGSIRRGEARNEPRRIAVREL
jgi:tripartite-type tricarboxylate transporter receptor subunit TctC